MTDTNDPNPMAKRIADSVREQLDDEDRSRRSFLGRSALAGGVLLALGSGAGLGLAQDDGEEEEADDAMTAAFDDVEGTDIDVLNYALALEHLENAFYREALDTFDEEDFLEAEALADLSESRRQEVFSYMGVVGAHESTHVEVLTQAVELLGGDPSPELEYDFGIEGVDDVLALGQVFENTGVAAYAGAAPFIESPDLLSAALSIHSVEARHAALFNEINGDSPFPAAFDEASSQQDVLDAVSGFIVPEEETEAPADDEDTETPAEESTTGNETATGTETATGNETSTETPVGDETTTDAPVGNETTGNGTDSEGILDVELPGNETATGNETTTTTATETLNETG